MFYCPFCKETFSDLIFAGEDHPVFREKKVVGAGYRPCLCPYCYSTDRERLILEYLTEETDILMSPCKVLHVSPERNLRRVLSTSLHIDYLPCDKSPESYKHPEYILEVDITRSQFADETFDVIICSHVLEHIADDSKAMSELYRILKSGGWAILQVPVSLTLEKTYEDPLITSRLDREKAFGQSDHVRLYSKSDYLLKLRANGFEVKLYNPCQRNYRESPVLKSHGINPEEDLILGWKPR